MNMPRDLPAIVTGPELARLLRRNRGPIRRARLVVSTPVELQSCEFEYRVELRDAVFLGRVILRDIHFHRTVDLRGCRFLGGLVMEGSCVGGSLLMDGVTVGPQQPYPDHCPENLAAARLGLVRVRGDLIARGLLCAGDLDLTRAEVRGRLELASTPRQLTVVAGVLRASAAYVGGDAVWNGIHVTDSVDAEGIRVGGKLALDPVREDAADSAKILFGSRVGGTLRLAVARISGELNMSAILVGGVVNLQTAEVRGGVFCRSKRGHRPVLLKDLHARGARIQGTADLSGVVLFGGVAMEGVSLVGTLFMQDAWGSYEGAPEELRASPARPDLRPLVGGEVALTNAQVTGSVKLHGACLGQHLTLDAAVISGFVDISRGWIAGGLNLRAATLKGGLVCRCADHQPPRILGPVLARAARIGAGVMFRGAILEREVDFAGADISGPVTFGGGCGRSEKGMPQPVPDDQLPCHVARTLDFSDAVIAGSLLGQGLRARGGIKLARAEVRGAVELLDAVIDPLPENGPRKAANGRGHAPVRTALDGVGARVRGALRLSGAMAMGAVNLQNARIGGGLFCGVAVPDGEDRDSHTVVVGPVMLDGAEVLTQADFCGATIHGELSLERARVEGRLRCDVAHRGDHAVAPMQALDVGNARIRQLHLEWAGQGARTVPILLEGCRFHEVTVPKKDYASLFGMMKPEDFRQGNYLAVERWLRERGEDDAAECVYDRMRAHRHTTLTGLARRWGDRSAALMRKGALHFQALAILSLLFFAFSVVIFADPASRVPGKARDDVARPASAAPAVPRAVSMSVLPPVDARAASVARADTPWTVIDAALLAGRFHLPMLTLPGKDQWEPSRERVWLARSVRYDGYATLISVLSYIVVPLVITGIVTTLLQRRSASR